MGDPYYSLASYKTFCWIRRTFPIQSVTASSSLTPGPSEYFLAPSTTPKVLLAYILGVRFICRMVFRSCGFTASGAIRIKLHLTVSNCFETISSFAFLYIIASIHDIIARNPSKSWPRETANANLLNMIFDALPAFSSAVSISVFCFSLLLRTQPSHNRRKVCV